MALLPKGVELICWVVKGLQHACHKYVSNPRRIDCSQDTHATPAWVNATVMAGVTLTECSFEHRASNEQLDSETHGMLWTSMLTKLHDSDHRPKRS